MVFISQMICKDEESTWVASLVGSWAECAIWRQYVTHTASRKGYWEGRNNARIDRTWHGCPNYRECANRVLVSLLVTYFCIEMFQWQLSCFHVFDLLFSFCSHGLLWSSEFLCLSTWRISQAFYWCLSLKNVVLRHPICKWLFKCIFFVLKRVYEKSVGNRSELHLVFRIPPGFCCPPPSPPTWSSLSFACFASQPYSCQQDSCLCWAETWSVSQSVKSLTSPWQRPSWKKEVDAQGKPGSEQ